MADVIVKQLFQSPDPPAFGGSKFRTDANVVKRLDDSLGACWPGTAANPGRVPTPTFQAPQDSEDEWDDPDAFDDYTSSRAALQQQQQRLAASPFDSGGGSVNDVAASSIQQQHPVQAVLQARTKQLQSDALLLAEQQQLRLHNQIQSVEQQLAQQLAQVQQHLQHKRARAAAADEESRQRRSAERSRRLQDVQRQQQALEQAGASALQGVVRAQEEAARARAEAEARQRQQQQEEERRRAEAAAAAAAAAKAAEQAKAQAAAAQQQQQQAAATAAAGAASQPAAAAGAKPGGAPPARPSDPHLKSTAAALAYEQLLAAKLAAAEADAAQLVADPALKQQRRALQKQITMAVSQISGTQQQVQDKSRQLIGLLEGCASPQQRALAYTTLASRIVSQCDGQVQKIGSFAFPLAYVCVAVGAAHPGFMELLLAKLQQACPLLVPKYVMYSPGQPRDEWYASLGYAQVEDNKSGQMRRETSDEYVARLAAMVLLYASIVQTEAAGNPAGLGHGWAWLARCINSLPPTRPSAAALMSFLAHAGYRMAAVYGRQFHKLMLHLTEHYIPALEAKARADADLRAVGTRLATYVTGRQFTKEPEGRSLKKVDESSYLRA